MTPARHTESFSYYYFNYFRHVPLLQKFAGPLVGAPFCGAVFGWTCWTCLNPPLDYGTTTDGTQWCLCGGEQKHAWLHGTRAVQASRGAVKQTSQQCLLHAFSISA